MLHVHVPERGGRTVSPKCSSCRSVHAACDWFFPCYKYVIPNICSMLFVFDTLRIHFIFMESYFLTTCSYHFYGKLFFYKCYYSVYALYPYRCCQGLHASILRCRARSLVVKRCHSDILLLSNDFILRCSHNGCSRCDAIHQVHQAEQSFLL